MSRREWYFWGYVLWFTFGLIGIIAVLMPYRIGLIGPPEWWGLLLGFIGGLLFFIGLEVTHKHKER